MKQRHERKILDYLIKRFLFAFVVVATISAPVVGGLVTGGVLWPDYWRNAVLGVVITAGAVVAVAAVVALVNYDINSDDLKTEWAKEAERPEGMPDYR